MNQKISNFNHTCISNYINYIYFIFLVNTSNASVNGNGKDLQIDFDNQGTDKMISPSIICSTSTLQQSLATTITKSSSNSDNIKINSMSNQIINIEKSNISALYLSATITPPVTTATRRHHLQTQTHNNNNSTTTNYSKITAKKRSMSSTQSSLKKHTPNNSTIQNYFKKQLNNHSSSKHTEKCL